MPNCRACRSACAIVDLAGGRQPQANEDGSIVTVFNGELYNHAALRRDLTARGHVFATHHSDTECVVHAFEEYGAAWPERARANGMFGLAIWDANASRLFLYRDRMGKKPLYYAAVTSGIAFASEIAVAPSRRVPGLGLRRALRLFRTKERERSGHGLCRRPPIAARLPAHLDGRGGHQRPRALLAA